MRSDTAVDSLPARVEQMIAREGMFARDDRVLVGVSGGLDSMVLLHILRLLDYTVEAAHFDHQTRGGESAADAAFVHETCRQLEIPCHGESEAVEEAARRAGRSFEAYARHRRYAFLTRTARERACRAVVTAHHEDDQAETVLMGLLGLASGFGWSGMSPVSEHDGVRIARPLLGQPREEIVRWARANAMVWREDSSNRDPCYLRNRIRAEVLPLLEDYGPQVRRNLARAAEIARLDTLWIDCHAARQLDAMLLSKPGEAVQRIDRAVFRQTPQALRRHIVKVIAVRLGVECTFDRIMATEAFICEAGTGKQFDFGQGFTIHAARTSVDIYNRKDAQPGPLPEATLVVPGTTCVGEYRFHTRILKNTPLFFVQLRNQCAPSRQYFDYDAMSPDIHIRPRRPGDRIVPFGMGHARKVQDVLVDARTPAYQRGAIPIVTAGSEILWIAGYRRSAAAPIRPTTERILEILVEKA